MFGINQMKSSVPLHLCKLDGNGKSSPPPPPPPLIKHQHCFTSENTVITQLVFGTTLINKSPLPLILFSKQFAQQ